MNDRGKFLRRVLIADAAACAAMGLGLFVGAVRLDDVLGLPVPLLRGCGLALLPFAALLAAAARPQPSATVVRGIVAANFAWSAASVALLLTDLVAPTAIGVTFVLVQAAAGVAAAEAELLGLKRTRVAIA